MPWMPLNFGTKNSFVFLEAVEDTREWRSVLTPHPIMAIDRRKPVPQIQEAVPDDGPMGPMPPDAPERS